MNIDHAYLENLWDSITNSDITEFDYKRIDVSCAPELCVGLSSSGDRCLVLELPPNSPIDFQPVYRKNLSLVLHPGCIIVLELKDPDFNAIFSDLAVSLYLSIRDIVSVQTYSQMFIETFYKWSDFFSERQTDRLSEEIVKGLYGELIVLKRFLTNANSSEVNEYLLSWKGPYDKGKDFELCDKDIEVKTKVQAKQTVSIANEHQLDPTSGKGLELWVVSILAAEGSSESISNVISEIKIQIVSRLGDLSIFLKALWQKGLTVENSVDYDLYKFKAVSISRYDASCESFPSIRRSALEQAIAKVKYDLRTTQLDQHLLEEINL